MAGFSVQPLRWYGLNNLEYAERWWWRDCSTNTVSLFPSLEVLYLEESWGINGASFPLEFEKSVAHF
jgi:hypothetical protein